MKNCLSSRKNNLAIIFCTLIALLRTDFINVVKEYIGIVSMELHDQYLECYVSGMQICIRIYTCAALVVPYGCTSPFGHKSVLLHRSAT